MAVPGFLHSRPSRECRNQDRNAVTTDERKSTQIEQNKTGNHWARTIAVPPQVHFGGPVNGGRSFIH